MSPHSELSLHGSEGNGADAVMHASPMAAATNGTPDLTNGATSGHVPSTDGSSRSANNNGGLHQHKQSQAKPQHNERSPYLLPSPADSEFDLICVGFGPASLAVAVALHDSLASQSPASSHTQLTPPKVLFIEKQSRFAWHAGMLLPGAKMQISFVKDLATLRDPRSEFTFLNYLHRQGRLVDFTNLGTFLPARSEYEDYLRWCASFFDDVVRYGRQVVSVAPAVGGKGAAVTMFTVQARDAMTGQMESFKGRNVLLATGGAPSLPKSLPAEHPRVIHSSQYAHRVRAILPEASAPYRIAVVGAGQSAAEIFHSLQTLYPNSQTWLVMRQEFLRPSDDSPFINSVFNPEYVDTMFPRSAAQRSSLLTEARATNYGVVRLELLERIYEDMYEQRRALGADERAWPHRILGARHITGVKPASNDRLMIKTRPILDALPGIVTLAGEDEEETLEADLVIAATGYQRTAHVDMLRDTWDMLPSANQAAKDGAVPQGVTGWTVEASQGPRRMAVRRDYGVEFEPGRVEAGSGIWLQGCCEGTHGLSDTLLSVLATRSGEIVESIFGQRGEAREQLNGH